MLNEAEVPSEDVVGESSRFSWSHLVSPHLQLRGRFGCGLVFDWIDLCADLLVGLNSGAVRRGGGEPAVRFSAAGQGTAAAGLRRRSAELLGAQGRRIHRRDQVASPTLVLICDGSALW